MSWDRIKRIFQEVLERSDHERSQFLEMSCDGDFELRREVESLLACHTRAVVRTGGVADALARATTETIVDSHFERAGTIIGPYKLLQQIGEGGFGAVFLAEQNQPVRRRVAIKVIKLGMDTKAVIARFEAERQALALMDHPHIARVLDGGATETGRPYFVMEYVTGDSITKFCDTHKLGVAERLELFSQVCSAIHHAHTKGIIHRDIKPGNVLVSMTDGKPFAKVIDFGIAKATAARLTEKTLFTEHRQLIGTPEYMSPEQAEGSADIDTRTDVYALGVLLYELLSGVTPFDAKRLRSAAYAELQRIIREEEPQAPSIRLNRDAGILAATAAARQTDPQKLGIQIRGELDWIVMKAINKDRARRYGSPHDLASDVGRYLTGDAVLAAPPSRAYRLRKFVRRNRIQALAVIAVAAAICIGGLIATWQWTLARRERNVAEQLNATLIGQRSQAERGMGRMMSILTNGATAGPIHMGPLQDGRSEADDPLADAIDLGIQFAESLKEERDKLETANATLLRQRDIASKVIVRLSAILSYESTSPEVPSQPGIAFAAEFLEHHPELKDAPDGERQLQVLGAYAISTAEKLNEEMRRAMLAEASLIVAQFLSSDLPTAPYRLNDLAKAVATRERFLGATDIETISVRWIDGIIRLYRGQREEGLAEMRRAASDYERLNDPDDKLVGMYENLVQAEVLTGNMESASRILDKLIALVDSAGQGQSTAMPLEFAVDWPFQPGYLNLRVVRTGFEAYRIDDAPPFTRIAHLQETLHQLKRDGLRSPDRPLSP